MRAILLSAVAFTLALTGVAGAQAVRDFSQVRRHLMNGDRVLVTLIDAGGVPIRVSIVEVTDDALIVRRGRERLTLRAERVVRIERPRDGLNDGALFGMLAGIAAGAIIGGATYDGCRKAPDGTVIPGGPSCGDKDWARLAGGLGGGLVGAPIGALVDRARKRDPVVYQRE